MTQYQKGAARERQVADRLRSQGWIVVRAAGSKGTCGDLVALRSGHQPRFYEIKATKAGPYAGFPPKDRAALKANAERAGAAAYLCWWPAGKHDPAWMPAEGWPDGKTGIRGR